MITWASRSAFHHPLDVDYPAIVESIRRTIDALRTQRAVIGYGDPQADLSTLGRSVRSAKLTGRSDGSPETVSHLCRQVVDRGVEPGHRPASPASHTDVPSVLGVGGQHRDHLNVPDAQISDRSSHAMSTSIAEAITRM